MLNVKIGIEVVTGVLAKEDINIYLDLARWAMYCENSERVVFGVKLIAIFPTQNRVSVLTR